jgi:hypothetical protein
MVAADAEVEIHGKPNPFEAFQGAFWLQSWGHQAAPNTTQQWSR